MLEKQQAAAARLGVEVVPLPVSDLPIWESTEWDAALATAVRSGAQMFSMHPPGFVLQRMAAWAIEHRTIVFGPVEQGFVMNYFADPGELMRSTARLVDNILRGAKPADLPVEQARHFRLGVNARTAKAMRFRIPKDLLARADQVIE